MATTFTSILGLKLSTDFTDELTFNFNKLDTLGTIYQTNASGGVTLRSQVGINFEPNSTDLGGLGSGGTVTFASAASPATLFDVHADSVDFNGAPITGLQLEWTEVLNKTANDLPDLTAFITSHADVAAATAHLALTNNPHSVTAAQVGAYTIAATDVLLDAVEDASEADLLAHAALTSTHGVAEIAGLTETQTLTNKTITASTNTISGLTDANFSLGSTTFPYSSLALTGSLVFADLDAGFALPWTSLTKSGSSLSEIETRPHSALTGVGTNTHTQIDSHLASTTSHGTTSSIAGISDTQTLTNKTIAASSNTITGLTDTNIDAAAAIAGSKINPDFGNQPVKTLDGLYFEEGGFTTSFKAAQAGQIADIDWELPADAGLSGQVLQGNGAGRLSWTSVLGSSLQSAEVDIGSPGNVRQAVDTAALGDVAASTAGGLQIKAASITASHISALDTDDLTEGVSNLYYASSLFDTDFAAKDTDDLSEGLTNFYYTEARFDASLAAEDTDALSEGAANFYYTEGRFDTSLSGKTTTNLTEGTNFYYTDARFDTRLGTKDTDDLSEGSSNFYFTADRFDTQFATKDTDDLVEGTNFYYTQGRFDSSFSSTTTDSLSEGITNFYWTQARFDSALSDNRFTATWLNSTGTTKVVTHGLNSLLVMIQVFDDDTGETIHVDTAVRTDVDNITLTATEAPATSWTVLITKAG